MQACLPSSPSWWWSCNCICLDDLPHWLRRCSAHTGKVGGRATITTNTMHACGHGCKDERLFACVREGLACRGRPWRVTEVCSCVSLQVVGLDFAADMLAYAASREDGGERPMGSAQDGGKIQ